MDLKNTFSDIETDGGNTHRGRLLLCGVFTDDHVRHSMLFSRGRPPHPTPPIYQPPAFFWWWFAYDAYARDIFTEGAYIAASGGIAAVILASGQFAMFDDGMGFQRVPWRPALEQQLGKQVLGTVAHGQPFEWTIGRSRGIGT